MLKPLCPTSKKWSRREIENNTYNKTSEIFTPENSPSEGSSSERSSSESNPEPLVPPPSKSSSGRESHKAQVSHKTELEAKGQLDSSHMSKISIAAVDLVLVLQDVFNNKSTTSGSSSDRHVSWEDLKIQLHRSIADAIAIDIPQHIEAVNPPPNEQEITEQQGNILPPKHPTADADTEDSGFYTPPEKNSSEGSSSEPPVPPPILSGMEGRAYFLDIKEKVKKDVNGYNAVVDTTLVEIRAVVVLCTSAFSFLYKDAESSMKYESDLFISGGVVLVILVLMIHGWHVIDRTWRMIRKSLEVNTQLQLELTKFLDAENGSDAESFARMVRARVTTYTDSVCWKKTALLFVGMISEGYALWIAYKVFSEYFGW